MQTVESLFCERYGCSSSEFPIRAFRKCCYLRARLIGPVLNCVLRDLFEPDFEFIRQLGAANNSHEVKAACGSFEDANRWPRTFLRSRLKIRVSGKKATRLAEDLFSQTPRTRGQNPPR